MTLYANGKKVVNAYRVYTEYLSSQEGALSIIPKSGENVFVQGTDGGSQLIGGMAAGVVVGDVSGNTYGRLFASADQGLMIGLVATDGRANHNLVICSQGNYSADWDLETPNTNPTVVVVSATNPASAAERTQKVFISHMATYGLLESKCGVQRIVGADGFETQNNAQLDTDGKYSGETAIIDVDSNAVGFAGALYMAADGNLDTADYNAETTAPCVCLAIDTGTGPNKRVLLRGFVREDDWNWTIGPGKTGFIYLDAAGALTQTAPTGDGDVVQIVGWAVTADSMYFNPSLNYTVVSA